MSYHYEDIGQFSSEQAALEWADRNRIDRRDLHIRKHDGGVDVGLRAGSAHKEERFDDR